ncbi:MAG: hypothetical protein WD904_04280 [Dehalococcoidia bacterium]
MTGDVFSRNRFVRSVARFILLGVLLPNFVYLGHWTTTGTEAHETTHHHRQPDAAADDAHTLHCHTGISKCGGAQAMVGALWVGEDAGLFAPDDAPKPILLAPAAIAPEPPTLLLLQPPKAA